MNTKEDIILKYKKKKSGWYTHYPINGLWSEDISYKEYSFIIKKYNFELNQNSNGGVHEENDSQLYIHFPFCPKQCLFCHCFTLITSKRDIYREMVEDIKKEIQIKSNLSNEMLPISDIHFGGGSPSVLEPEEIEDILSLLKNVSDKKLWHDVAIEIDPRNNINEEKLLHYATLGINRISFGIQDFNREIGKKINRIHTIEEINSLLTEKVRKSFRSINFDLLYGLPSQTLQTLEETIDAIKLLRPTRIAYYSFQHRPDLYKHQTAIKKDQLPSKNIMNDMSQIINSKLLKFGYEKLGLDHYINSADYYYNDLIKKKNVERNAIGYSPSTSKNIIGVGPSAMSNIRGHYFQNFYTLPNFKKNLKNNLNPIARGWISNNDDFIRREIIFDIINYGEIDIKKIENKFQINFEQYFSREFKDLKDFQNDKILNISDNKIKETEIGKELRIYIANIFDIFKFYKHSKEFRDGIKASDRIFQLKKIS